MIHVCVPVLKRYDLLRNMVESLRWSTTPCDVLVIDNGQQGEKVTRLLEPLGVTFEVFLPPQPMGVAASWNWFIRALPEPRVITNDDVIFAHDSLAKIVAAPLDLAWACGFSCFLIRDICIEKVGFFDEEISPGYGYYEDDDYLQRLDGRGTRPALVRADNVDAGVRHHQSATLAACTPAEIEEHHRKFRIAQGNYVKKWGLELEFEKERIQKEMVG